MPKSPVLPRINVKEWSSGECSWWRAVKPEKDGTHFTCLEIFGEEVQYYLNSADLRQLAHDLMKLAEQVAAAGY